MNIREYLKNNPFYFLLEDLDKKFFKELYDYIPLEGIDVFENGSFRNAEGFTDLKVVSESRERIKKAVCHFRFQHPIDPIVVVNATDEENDFYSLGLLSKEELYITSFFIGELRIHTMFGANPIGENLVSQNKTLQKFLEDLDENRI